MISEACCGAAVRCRAALDVGVEAVFEGAAPGYRLEKTAQAGKTAAVRGDAVERVLEEVRREFSGLPVYVGVEDGYVYVKRTAPMDERQFKKYLETCRWLGFRFDKGSSRWKSYSHLQRYKPASNPTQTPTGRIPLMTGWRGR